MRVVALVQLVSCVMAFASPAAQGQQAGSNLIDEVIVTAQKREQSANAVGMSITAASGDALLERGITSVTQLSQIVPGFTVQESAFNSTSFTLRGIGFFNSDLSTPPAVTVYLDEAPLPYPSMTQLASFDVERVEVLKGPQGTLYGQNATGGAVNYIAARPTDTLQLGLDATYGRFNRTQLGGFISGPLTEQLTARFAIQGQRGDGWQESITRPGDRLGRIRKVQGRTTVEWRPDERFVSRLTLSLAHDASEALAGQYIAPFTTVPALAVPGLLTFPVVTRPRAADWTRTRVDSGEPFPYAGDTTLYQASLRNEYELHPDITLTSLTAYSHSQLGYGQDTDGTPFHINEIVDNAGRISAFFQELRLAGNNGPVRWLLGANFSHDEVQDKQLNLVLDNDVCHIFQGVDPEAFCDYSRYDARTRVNTSGVFGRIEYDIAEQFTLEAAVRYNNDRRAFDNCGITLSQHLANYWNAVRGNTPPIARVGECYVMDPANGGHPVANVHGVLNEDSVSWKFGVNWTANPHLLMYANVSRGYKAGTAPVLGASVITQFTPISQESLLAYETGFKAGLLSQRAQLNAAVFYYDYDDKQLRGSQLDPTFGLLEALVSIPKSHVVGAEVRLTLRPLDGLAIDTGATYLDTQIDEFTGFDAALRFADQSNTPFPFSPKWQSVTNVDYEFALAAATRGFLGSSLVYNSKTYAGIGAVDVQSIDAHALLDLRAGIELEQGNYRVWAWGKNVTNRYYWSNVLPYGNTLSRYVGQPATYGLSISKRF